MEHDLLCDLFSRLYCLPSPKMKWENASIPPLNLETFNFHQQSALITSSLFGYNNAIDRSLNITLIFHPPLNIETFLDPDNIETKQAKQVIVSNNDNHLTR